MEYNDTLLITYLAMLTNRSRLHFRNSDNTSPLCSTMNELIDKFNTAYDRHGDHGRCISSKFPYGGSYHIEDGIRDMKSKFNRTLYTFAFYCGSHYLLGMFPPSWAFRVSWG